MLSRRRFIGTLLGAAALAPAAAVLGASEADAQVIVRVPPPPPRREPFPPPRRGQTWAPGYWRWSPRAQRYVWVSGTWMPSRPGWRYVPSGWVRRGGTWVYVPGRWVR
ncbi:YXWGXW repeat-containing protein [Aquabacter cavernae]|uniref:YXWGXW repeat-containing protein n=1 Tax=Aquabacter cavernae TaxID=2496029 RepID=UPI000F8D3E05|nr:YXWGXW repeat-containing protein [Aquabacter cavernae]